MKRPRTRWILIAAVGCCASAWWAMRPDETVAPAPIHAAWIAQPPTGNAAPAPDSAAIAFNQAAADSELETMAAMFAAEPALIDALEDATSAVDPAVRADAEQFLDALELPTPNPEPVAE
jgi:hypothetical protein